MSDIIRRPDGAVTPYPEGFSRSEGKGLQRRQNTEVANGLVIAARVQAAGYVAATGITIRFRMGSWSRATQLAFD